MSRSLDQDDKAVLLTLLEDMDVINWVFGNNSSDDSVASEDAPQPPSVNKPARKRKRRGYKHEILLLRSKIEGLEAELAATTKRVADVNGIDPRDVEVMAIWEELAVRQRHNRLAAEMENSQLREMLDAQVPAIKQLIRFLENQPREQDISGARAPKRSQIQSSNENDVSHDRLLKRMDDLYADVGSIFDPELEWVSCRNVRDVHVKEDLDGIVVELKLSWVVPFGVEVTARVLRECSERSSLPFRCSQLQTLPEKDRLSVATFSVATDATSDTVTDVPGHLYSRYYANKTGYVIVSETTVEPTACIGTKLLGCNVRSKGWMRIAPYSPNGELLSSATTRNLTHIQSLHRIRILSSQRPCVRMVTDIVLNHITGHVDESPQIVEDMLLQKISDDRETQTISSASTSSHPVCVRSSTSPTAVDTQPRHYRADADGGIAM